MRELNRFLKASIRLIAIQDKLLKMRECREILVSANASIEAITAVDDVIKSITHSKKSLQRYIIHRFEWIVTGEFDYDIEDFRFLTKKDIERGYIALNQEESYFLLLAEGKVVPFEYLKAARESRMQIPSPIKNFDLVWPV